MELLDEYISLIQNKVENLFKDDFSGHDLQHLLRTKNLALKIQEKEGGDRLIIGLSAYLHDIHRIMQSASDNYVSPKQSIPVVKEILEILPISEEDKEEICFCIEHHEDYNWNGSNVTDLNALILQDADNLDAIGAIGVARCFNYGGAYNLKMYDENIPFEFDRTYDELGGNEESSIHHFYHKLFKLGENMNTKTAKKMAEDRIAFMKNFVSEFLEEWEGLK